MFYMKIFYIEDQLSRNIARVRRLFSEYLSEAQREVLHELETDASGYFEFRLAVANIYSAL